MAEARSINTCSICLEDFTRPTIIPCFHTFCERCLDSHIQAHALFNKFNCPNCRREIEVPVGGANSFTHNFYLDEINLSQKQYCTKHKDKKIEFYCSDCCVASCGNCVIINHKTHTVVDLTDMDQEYRTKLTSSKETLEKKIHQLKSERQLLQDKSDSIITSAAIAFNACDTQVEKIYAEAKRLAAEFRERVNQLLDVETGKLQNLISDKDSYIAQLQTAVECSTTSLTGTSTKPLIDIFPSVETLTEDINTLSTCVPVVKHPYFPLVEINTDSLKTQIGELQTMDESTFTASFNLGDIKEDVRYYSDDYIVQGLPWYVGVSHSTSTSKLGIYLGLQKGEDTTVTSCTADQTFKLLHHTDDSKSVVGEYTSHVFKPDEGWGRRFIDWNKLTDPTNGFIHNNRFTVQATVKITNIER